eukprot:scaffold1842_cov57-Cyclotella_meneghiniana.AAC.1
MYAYAIIMGSRRASRSAAEAISRVVPSWPRWETYATKECSRRTTPRDTKITEECFLFVRGRSLECFDCVAKQSSSACDTALECELKLVGHGI